MMSKIMKSLGMTFFVLPIFLSFASTSIGGSGESSSQHQTNWGPKEVEKYVTEHIVEIAEGIFVENLGLSWTIHGFELRDDLTYVEIEPQPDEVGYSRFKFVIYSPGPEIAHVIACYCLENGAYSLLFTDSRFSRQFPERLD
ncbi:MAG: hypothetical protein GTO08_08110 [Deltaproteobacteria bacterium]|nr:hypothetical protein [Deltaproteobacteria bacterium]